MSLASIQKVVSVSKHPNADKLDLVKVLGYECIVPRDKYKVDDLVVFIEPDTVLPDAPWATFYNSKSNRVKAVKLRGIFSFGIIESFENVGLDRSAYAEDTDVTEVLGVTKYSPPEPQDLSASGLFGNGVPKTDETRYQGLRNIPYGELVDVPLKVDGQSLSYFFEYQPDTDSYNVDVGGRSFKFKKNCDNNYTKNIANLGAEARLEAFCRANGNVSLVFRGESYGSGIQKMDVNPHSKLPLGLAFYSVWNIDERRYETKGSKFYLYDIAKDLGLPTCPMIERNVVLTPELIAKYDSGIEFIDGKPFEGVVIQWAGGSFKVINKHYDAKK